MMELVEDEDGVRRHQVFVPRGQDGSLDLAKQASELIDRSAKEFDIAKRTPDELLPAIVNGQSAVAIQGGRLVGFVYFKKWEDNSLSVSGLVVCESMRGKGIARELLQSMNTAAKEKYPYGKLFLLTTNERVIKMAESLGYRDAPLVSVCSDEQFWVGCRGCKSFEQIQSDSSLDSVTPCGSRCCCKGYVCS